MLVSPPLVGVFNRKFRQEISTENFQRKIFQCRQSTSQSVDNQSTSQSTSQSTISQSTSQSVDNHISSACPSGQGGSVRRVAAVPALSPSSALCQSVRRGLFVGRRYHACFLLLLRAASSIAAQEFRESASAMPGRSAERSAASERSAMRSCISLRMSQLLELYASSDRAATTAAFLPKGRVGPFS